MRFPVFEGVEVKLTGAKIVVGTKVIGGSSSSELSGVGEPWELDAESVAQLALFV